MTRLQSWLLIGFAGGLTAATLYGGFGLSRIGYTALEKWSNAAPDLKPTLDAANTTLALINSPCIGFHGSVTCGPLAQLSQTEKNVGILAGKSAEQVQQTGTLVTAVAHNLDAVGDSVKQVAGKLSGTADAATETLGEGKRTIAAAQPLLASLTRASDASTLSIQHFDALLTSKDLADAMKHATSMTASGDTIMGDAKKVADDATKKYFAPIPWYRKGLPYVTTGAKIMAYALPWP